MGLEKLKGSDLSVAAASVTGASTYARTLEAAKLSESTAKRWRRIARHWPLKAVERYLSERFQHDKLPAQTKKPDREVKNRGDPSPVR